METFIDQKIRKSLAVLKENFYRCKTGVKQAFFQESTVRIDVVEDAYWEAASLPFVWDRSQKYGAIKANFSIPEQMAGVPVDLIIQTGHQDKWDYADPQFLLTLNGEPFQGIDFNHRTARICERAIPGSVYEAVFTGFLGEAKSEPLITLTLAAVNRSVVSIYYDLEVLYEISLTLKPEDDTRLLLEQTMNDALNLVDFRYVQSEAFFASVQKASEYMARFFEEKCGAPGPEVYMIGHTHIDVAWLWPLMLTKMKSVCSFSTVNRLMERFGEYKFLSSQPQLYEFVKDLKPELYETVKRRIKEGRWEAEGAMWLEADCNLSSGEALIRQILFGKRFFKEEFGVENKILWLPDVFGYSAALPQILKKSGVEYFITSKISWNDRDKMPYDTFLWEGIDGTDILTYFITTCNAPLDPDTFYTTYNGNGSPSEIKGTWERYQQKDLFDKVLAPVGFGDGGGGTTPEMIERAKRMEKGIPGCPRLKFASAGEFFRTLDAAVKENSKLPKWVGELYLEFHRGTYTTMNKTKKYNRKSEILYQDAEFFAVLASRASKTPYPQEALRRGWKTILLNQFHDILPGSSIKEVYDESYRQYEKLTQEGEGLIGSSLLDISSAVSLSERSVVVFNNLGFLRTDLVWLDEPCGIRDGETQIDTQVTHDGRLIFVAPDVPQKGYKAFALSEYKAGAPLAQGKLIGGRIAVLDSLFYTAQFDEDGNLTRLYDKEYEREVIKPGETTMVEVYEDMPAQYENWDIAPYYEEKRYDVAGGRAILLENGPVRAVVRVEKPYFASMICYDVIFYRHTRRIDFNFAIDWKEPNVLVKFKIPADIQTAQATYEIQYGHLKRNTHRNTSWDSAKYEVCAHKWADVSESNYGISMLNDCKYGHQIYEGNLRWTLNKSTCNPNPDAGKDEQEFTLALLPHGGADLLPTIREAYFLNTTLRSKISEPQGGELPAVYSLVSLDNEAVVLEVVKKAEYTNGVILRMYETTGGRQNVTVTTDFPCRAVFECDLMEQDAVLMTEGDSFTAQFKPFEIKTFLLR